MHRHGYKGRKLSRTKDIRRLLIKNLSTDLFDKGQITTTVAKAKEVVSYSEKLITKSKKQICIIVGKLYLNYLLLQLLID